MRPEGEYEPMRTQRFTVLLTWDAEESVWVTSVPALNYLSTFGDTREQAIENTREAVLGYLETAQREGIPIPASDRMPEVTQLEVAVP